MCVLLNVFFVVTKKQKYPSSCRLTSVACLSFSPLTGCSQTPVLASVSQGGEWEGKERGVRGEREGRGKERGEGERIEEVGKEREPKRGHEYKGILKTSHLKFIDFISSYCSKYVNINIYIRICTHIYIYKNIHKISLDKY